MPTVPVTGERTCIIGYDQQSSFLHIKRASRRSIRADHCTVDICRSANYFRVSAVGCSRSARNSPVTVGPARNRSSHRWPCGMIIRLQPILRISTHWTFPGKATAFGSRMICLRALNITVDFTMSSPFKYSAEIIKYGNNQFCKAIREREEFVSISFLQMT